jgi:diguanylate cyclase (GGDEF)-like protein
MQSSALPMRSATFRLITIAAAGIGSFTIGMWGFSAVLGPNLAGLPVPLIGGVVAALCALAASLAALSFFAGVDESAHYVYRETQLDKLTGLHSRVAMIGKLAEAVSRSQRTGDPVFLIDIDIHRFKSINDAIGFGDGDQLVRAFAMRLRESFDARATLGRIGAGEFAILLPDNVIDGSLEEFFDALLSRLAEPYQLPSHLQAISVSAGIVAVPRDGDDPVLLVRRANLALQNARMAGPGAWATYDGEMGRVADHRQWIESELGVAFERGDFDVHYQPQFDLGTGGVVGYEALLRWRHPERGMIPPTEFVPVAEETGMIGQIGLWVLRRACTDAVHLPADCPVAVNISAVQFVNRDFVASVRKVLEETGLPAGRLELEITETAMMIDRPRAAAILDELAAMGISVAIDDFGTGYSNLAYLMDFKFQKLKIDRSFVARLDTAENSGAMISTIVGLSRALGVRTIAEGVETEEQAILLRAAGCESVQGFFYGRPVPLSQVPPAAVPHAPVHLVH